MGEKGQISLFVIIGLVLLIAAVLVFFLMNKGPMNIFNPAPSQESKMIESAVDNCLRRAAPDAIIPFFKQGFFYEIPEAKEDYSYEVPTELISLPYITKHATAPYFKQTTSLVVDEETFQNNYALFVRDGVKECFENATLPGVEFNAGEPSVSAQIGTMSVITLDYPITIITAEKTEEIRDFSLDLEYDMKTKYEFVRSFVENEEQQFISIEKLGTNAYEQNYTFEMINIDEDDVAYRLNYGDYLQKYDEELILNFIIRY